MKRLIGLAAACMFFQGCTKIPSQPQQTGPQMPTSATAPATEESYHTRVEELRREVSAMNGPVGELPGRGEADHRKLMQAVFTSLHEILPKLEGPTQSPGFAFELRTVGTTASQVGSMSPDLSVDATIDQGLGATRDALAEIKSSLFSDDVSFDQKLGELSARITELETVRGPLHRSVVKQAVEQVHYLLRTMVDALAKKVGEDVPASAKPTEPQPADAKPVPASAPAPAAAAPVPVPPTAPNPLPDTPAK